MKKRDEPKFVISIQLEIEDHKTLQKMARDKGLFIPNGKKKGEPNISGLIKQLAREYKTMTYAQEIYQEIVKIAKEENLQLTCNANYSYLIDKAVSNCKLTYEFEQERDWITSDIMELIDNREED